MKKAGEAQAGSLCHQEFHLIAKAIRSISRIVKERLRKVGLYSNRLTAHSLRHTAITLSIKGGASLQQAQAMARHSDPKSTMIYFHNLNRLQAGAERFRGGFIMKENLTGNSLFKIAIVIIGIIFLVLYYDQSLNGRYKVIDKDDERIFDTRTGIIFSTKANETEIIDQVNGTIRYIPLKELNEKNKK